MSDDLQNALRVARTLVDIGQTIDEAVTNPAINSDLRDQVRAMIRQERTMPSSTPRVLTARTQEQAEWLNEQDRSNWYYWPRLREFLISTRGWPEPEVRSIDNATDRILAQMVSPEQEEFDIRGLVLGYVQSGKTANFSGLIAKAVDTGFRLVIVLSGIHNSLRQQTQRRLGAELVGYTDSRPGSVPLPPQGKWWATFTSENPDGDFDPGLANYATLQGTQPVLMVVKKNASVLRRLSTWLDMAPEEVRRHLPVLVIDDEADQASVNTRGNQPPDEEEPDSTAEESAPSVINGLIRELLSRFHCVAYVAYTATPFANVLIPHNAVDRDAGADLYPKDFIVDLPKPAGYFGAEEIFGRPDAESQEERDGLNVIHIIPDEELAAVTPATAQAVPGFQPSIPPSLENALLDFVLAGAARRQRGGGWEPATMLIHTHLRTIIQRRLTERVSIRLAELRDEWRYQREFGIRDRLETRWSAEFRPLIRSLHAERDVPFDRIEEHVGPFFEAIEVKQINSYAEDILDYQRDPGLKTVVIGGNRLSRGLTLEGLLTSYYIRRTTMYDTLMQMGRWFGFREGYEDLTRINTTRELAGWFRDLAIVEYELRSDLQVYERDGVKPIELGPRILKHPAMMVTSPLKMRYATEVTIDQSYAGQLLQTTTFPFENLEFLRGNIDTVRKFIAALDGPNQELSRPSQPVWTDVPWEQVIDFLTHYQVGQQAAERAFPPELIRTFVTRMAAQRELTNWTMSIRGLQSPNQRLGHEDLGVAGGEPINLIARTRLRNTPESIGVLTSPSDEGVGLTPDQLEHADKQADSGSLRKSRALRAERQKSEGLLLIYPISQYSMPTGRDERSRVPLFEDPERGATVIGVALSFPVSGTAVTVHGTYVVGTVGWRAL